ncbi:hypothetical protein AD953_12810 [Acetobacter malorum]|uniref:VIT family protein n=1 Tax=Acetobacter malorum TaxID=178901 RepID=A0A149V1U2_9PROT|nr:hypothetical protein [Acetobacter malorum]KXV74177.1 hypothetical protein AD953_12810 [Acetobacter malorum]
MSRTFSRWLRDPENRLDIVAGMVDGILNALTLASGSFLKAGHAITLTLALRVGAAAALTTLFVFFVAHYAQERTALVGIERELNLRGGSHLAATALGRKALVNSALGAALAAICGLAGSVAPLLLAMILPGPPWMGLIATLTMLALLGVALARAFHGSRIIWGTALFLGGGALAYVGLKLGLVQ